MQVTKMRKTPSWANTFWFSSINWSKRAHSILLRLRIGLSGPVLFGVAIQTDRNTELLTEPTTDNYQADRIRNLIDPLLA
jgi:hypothetical protein